MGPREREQRLQIMLGDDELKALDEWRFTHRMPSQAVDSRADKAGSRGRGLRRDEAGPKVASYGILDERKPSKRRAKDTKKDG
jgi:hypothetical protein